MLQIPQSLINAYRKKLLELDLIDAALSEQPVPRLIGGSGHEETLQHFAGRYGVSVCRVESLVIDPENEYQSLIDQVWWSYLDVSLNSNQRINPFDLPLWLKDYDEKPGDLLRSAVINLLGLMNLMLGKMTAEEESIMEKWLITTYSLKWITLEEDNVEWKDIPPW